MNESYDKLRSTILANLGLDFTVTDNLLKLYFTEDIKPDQLAQFFSKYDIEALDYQSVWLLSKLASALHYNGVPKEQIPRIKGVVRRFTVENGRQLCALPGLLEAFNKADISVMLLNGTAMKTFYEPAETRYSGNIDILVYAGDIKKTGLVLEEQGFILKDVYWEQRVFQKNDVRIVVHGTYLRSNLLTGELADVWQHSLEIDWQGKRIRVPSPEMMLLMVLTQGLEACGFRIQDGQANNFVNCFLDSKFFLDKYVLGKHSTDRNLLCRERFIVLAVKCRLTLHAHLMLDIINHLYPGFVPEELLAALPFSVNDVANVQRLISYNVAKKQVAEARERRNRMEYCYKGIVSLWHLNCYYGNRNSFLSNIVDFPKCVTGWSSHKGLDGLLSKLGGFAK